MNNFSYKDILKDEKIQIIYKEIDEKTNYVVSHGLIHMKNVLKHAKRLANTLRLSQKSKSLLLISATLHDIGRFDDNNNHNISGALFARNYLSDKLKADEIEIVANAIIYHCKESVDFNAMEDIAWCLILADKLDFEKTRLIKSLLYQATKEKYDLYKHTNKISVDIVDSELIINIFTKQGNFEEIFKKYKKNTSELFTRFIEHFKLKNYKFNIVIQ